MNLKIFLVEDDLDDIELLQDALDKSAVAYEMTFVNDGNSAINYIKEPTAIPDIVILDMNLPKVHGREVIQEIKSSPLFNKIPLLILTTSTAREDIEYAYENGAARYLKKPDTVEGIRETIRTILQIAGK